MSDLNVVVFFDYDLTLSEEYQQMPLIKSKMDQFQARYPEMKEPIDFFAMANKHYAQYDPRIAYMYQFIKDSDIIGPGAQDALQWFGTKVKLAKGLPNFLPNFKQHHSQRGVNVDFHCISMGLHDMITRSPIAQHMSSITASHFEYDDDGTLMRPSRMIGPFDKIGAIIETVKGGTNSRDKLVHPNDYQFDYRNVICIGDGFSDVPKMCYVRERGGFSILVYPEGGYHKLIAKKELLERVSAVVPRDYSDNGPIWNIINHFISVMKNRACGDEWDPRILHIYRKNQSLLRKDEPSILPYKLKSLVEEHLQECDYCRFVATDQLLVIKPDQKEFFATTPGKVDA